jgi:hypothetical protein
MGVFLNFEIYKQILIFLFYVALAFGITSCMNRLFRLKKMWGFILPIGLLLISITFLFLGIISSYYRDFHFIQYSILGFCSFIGSAIASCAYYFSK